MMEFQHVSMKLWGAKLLVALPVPVGIIIAAWWFPWALWFLLACVLYIPYTYIQVRHTAWRTTDVEIEVRTGRLWQKTSYVPYGRIQFFEVERGAIAHLLGLSEISVRTASMSADVKIPGIPASQAQQLKKQLSKRAQEGSTGV